MKWLAVLVAVVAIAGAARAPPRQGVQVVREVPGAEEVQEVQGEQEVQGGQRRPVVPPLRVDMAPPPPPAGPRASLRNVLQAWIDMPVDHFDPQNTDTFPMRYMFNEEFFGGEGSPIFIMVGGEWDITPGWLGTGNMYEMARESGGIMYYTEHRYYGQTGPYESFTAESLRFLNVDQALADLAHFIRTLRLQPRLARSQVVLYGGSYAANMALWFKQRYPHLVAGVVASSGPIQGEVDFTGYLEVVHEAFRSEGGEACVAQIQQGILDTVAAMETEQGRRELEAAYRLCAPLDYDSEWDLGYFSGLITWTFSTDVQQARPGTLLPICDSFTTGAYGATPMEAVGGYVAASRGLGAGCWQLSYAAYVQQYAVPRSNSKAWYWQTCTEYGYYQTAPRSGTAFDALRWLSVEWYVDLCRQAFDTRFDTKFVHEAVERVNLVFGGLQPQVNRTVNIHGTVDPWHALGVHEEDLGDTSPTFAVPRASHCFDMQPWLNTDTIRMTAAQQAARRAVREWLAPAQSD